MTGSQLSPPHGREQKITEKN